MFKNRSGWGVCGTLCHNIDREISADLCKPIAVFDSCIGKLFQIFVCRRRLSGYTVQLITGIQIDCEVDLAIPSTVDSSCFAVPRMGAGSILFSDNVKITGLIYCDRCTGTTNNGCCQKHLAASAAYAVLIVMVKDRQLFGVTVLADRAGIGGGTGRCAGSGHGRGNLILMLAGGGIDKVGIVEAVRSAGKPAGTRTNICL